MVKSKGKRVFAIVRQSDYKDGSMSLEEQHEKIAEWCERQGHTLVQVAREKDVSGQRALEKRPGLHAGVLAVEDNLADLVVVGYFDRLVRSLRTQAEMMERVERALKARKVKDPGVVALDVGNISHATAASWLTAQTLGMVAEYYARSVGERVHAAIVRAVNEGRPPFQLRAGLRKREDGTVEHDPKVAPLILQAFTMRAQQPTPATLEAIRDYLNENGLDVGSSTVEKMLRSKQYLGEIHWGELENLNAWEPIVPRPLWDRVQAVRSPRGRLGKSDLLLARQHVLLCETCRGRMSAGYVFGKDRAKVPTYRCQKPKRDCATGAVIYAHEADAYVLAETERLLRDVEGHAAVFAELDEAEAAADAAQDALTRAVRVLAVLDDEEAARQELLALQTTRDAARARFDELRAIVVPLETFRAEDLAGAEVCDQRRAIRIALDAVLVRPAGNGKRLVAVPRGSKAGA